MGRMSSTACIITPTSTVILVAHFFPVVLLWLVDAVFAYSVEQGVKIFVRSDETFFVFIGVVDAFPFYPVVFDILCVICPLALLLSDEGGVLYLIHVGILMTISSSSIAWRDWERSNALKFSREGSPCAHERRNF